jgi:hypothetical protein
MKALSKPHLSGLLLAGPYFLSRSCDGCQGPQPSYEGCQAAKRVGSNLGHRFYGPKVAILLSLRLHLGRSALQWDCKTKHFLQKERAKVGSFAALPFVGFLGFVNHSVRPNAALF